MISFLLKKKVVMTTTEVVLLGIALVLLFIFIKDGRKKLAEKLKQRKEKRESDRKHQEDVRVKNAQSLNKFKYAQLVGDKRVDINKEQAQNNERQTDDNKDDTLEKKKLPKFELKQKDMPSITDADSRVVTCPSCGTQHNKNFGACPKCGTPN